jgi:hypothetical protein
MSKDNSLYKTLELKSKILKDCKNPVDQLRIYIKDNNFNKFQQLMSKHLNLIESGDKHKNTLLNLAVQCNNIDIARYLLELGAKVNTQNVSLCL